MSRIVPLLRRYVPILTWAPDYSRRTLTNDLIVAGIVTIMLIPQSLAYALLALRCFRHLARARGRPSRGG
jgi:hypothetical protein